MKYLLIGVWRGESPHVQTHKTDRSELPEGASYSLTRHADRMDVPDEILVIHDERGPVTLYHWSKGSYTQAEFDQMRAELMAYPPRIVT